PSAIVARMSDTSNQSGCRTVSAARAMPLRTACWMLSRDVPTTSVMRYVGSAWSAMAASYEEPRGQVRYWLVMVSVSGDGFVIVADGSRRWGRFGAAGVLVRHTGDDGAIAFFLARRSEFCHRGGTWAIPGGALNSDEEPLAGALREFAEDIGV